MTSRWLVSLIVLGLASPPAARAEGQVVEVEVGQTVELETGYARGLLCDDLTIIDADLRNKTDETNALYLTGKATGTTLCRVGTDALHIRFLFDVHVVAARSRPAPPPPPPKPRRDIDGGGPLGAGRSLSNVEVASRETRVQAPADAESRVKWIGEPGDQSR